MSQSNKTLIIKKNYNLGNVVEVTQAINYKKNQ